MTAITMRTFVDELEAMTVTGVNRNYTSGPPDGSPPTADIPCKYIWGGETEDTSLVFGEQGGNGTLSAQLVILVNPVNQKTGPENYDASVDMVDNLKTAIRAMACTLGRLDWRANIIVDFGPGSEKYWKVIAEINGRDFI
jgi:hypothetical protein